MLLLVTALLARNIEELVALLISLNKLLYRFYFFIHAVKRYTKDSDEILQSQHVGDVWLTHFIIILMSFLTFFRTILLRLLDRLKTLSQLAQGLWLPI